MEREKLTLRNYIGHIVAGTISCVSGIYLTDWILSIRGETLRYWVVFFLSFYFVFTIVDEIVLSLLKKVHIRSKHLPDV